MGQVGTDKVFEDDSVTIWKLQLAPGELGQLHTHERDFVVRILSGSTVEVSNGTGEVLYQVERHAGEMGTFRIVGDEITSDFPGSRNIPATHRVRNIGQETFCEVLIEFKTPGAAPR